MLNIKNRQAFLLADWCFEYILPLLIQGMFRNNNQELFGYFGARR